MDSAQAGRSGDRRLEVRCCCDPGRLLGWLEIPPDVDVAAGEALEYLLPLDTPRRLEEDAWDVRPYPTELVDLTIDTWSRPGGGARFGFIHQLAVRSNDTPIETLRRVPGFVEASPEDVYRDADRQFRDAVGPGANINGA